MPHRRHTPWFLLLLLLLPACQERPDSSADVPRITPEEVVALLDAGQPVVIVDTRAPRQYERHHVRGAISIPARETEDHLDKLPLQATIALYWTWSKDQTSARAALILYENGYKKAYVIKGGLEAWERAGYPVESP